MHDGSLLSQTRAHAHLLLGTVEEGQILSGVNEAGEKVSQSGNIVDLIEVSRVGVSPAIHPGPVGSWWAAGCPDDEHKGERLFGPLTGGGLLFILGLL